MSGLLDLPNELQLMVLEQPILTTLDLVLLYATTTRWRKLIQDTSTLQERAFLRTLTPPYHPSLKPMTETTVYINATLISVPSTFLNDFAENLHDLVWEVDYSALGMSYLPLEYDSTDYRQPSPIVDYIKNWMHLLNPHFKHYEETPKASGRDRRALRFHDLTELSLLLADTTKPHASWHDVLVSHYPIQHVRIYWSVKMRRYGRKRPNTYEIYTDLANRRNVRLGEFIMAFAAGLRQMRECFNEDNQGKIEPKENKNSHWAWGEKFNYLGSPEDTC